MLLRLTATFPKIAFRKFHKFCQGTFLVAIFVKKLITRVKSLTTLFYTSFMGQFHNENVDLFLYFMLRSIAIKKKSVL